MSSEPSNIGEGAARSTPRQRFIHALQRRPPVSGQRVPHYEMVFFLTMQAFGKVHPNHRNYGQWLQMEERERQLHRRDMAELYVRCAERFDHHAIFIHENPHDLDELLRQVDLIREISGDRYFLMAHGDATFAIPPGDQMAEFSYRMIDDAAGLKAHAADKVRGALDRAEALARHGGLDGFALCDDYCFNTGPFLSPAQFGEFIAPYLAQLIAGYRGLNFYAIKHTDGNIMPIIDMLIQARPHALHSLDPQGGMDIAQVKRRYGKEVCLCGNVNCGLLDTGTDAQVVESARYALKHGMPDGGYIFCTSNCIYTGMPLARYELMLDVWRREGTYA